MRTLLLALCLLLGPVANGAFAQERASLTPGDAMSLCESWLAGTLRDQDVELRGWQRLESRPQNILLMPMASFAGEMNQVSLIREDFPDAEQRHCSFQWRFSDAADRLATASDALRSRGFRTQLVRQSETQEVVTASRIARGLALAHAQIIVVPCQPVVIGPNRGPCPSATVAELGLYVVETRQKNQSE